MTLNPFAFLAVLTGLLFAFKTFKQERKEIIPNIPVNDFQIGPDFQTSFIDSLYIANGKIYNVDPALLKAMAIVESNENQDAINKADPSYGLMQVLCPSDGPNGICKNRLPAIPEFTSMTPNKLLNPADNVNIGASLISWNINQWGFQKGIAAYNSRAAQKSNVPENGPFPNQGYVDEVLREFTALKNRQFGEFIL